MIRYALHALGHLVDIAGDHSLLLLVQMLACLAQRLRDSDEAVDSAVLLGPQVCGGLLLRLLRDVAGRILSLIDHLVQPVLRLVVDNTRAGSVRVRLHGSGSRSAGVRRVHGELPFSWAATCERERERESICRCACDRCLRFRPAAGPRAWTHDATDMPRNTAQSPGSMSRSVHLFRRGMTSPIMTDMCAACHDAFAEVSNATPCCVCRDGLSRRALRGAGAANCRSWLHGRDLGLDGQGH